MVNYKLCAFADEADKALAGQIRAMQENGIAYLEMRGVNGINVAKLTTTEAKAAAAELKAAGIKVWSLGSPAGKTPITDPFDFEKEQFKRLLETADITGAHAIRLFSFYGTEGKDEYFDEVCRRLSRFIEMAKEHDVVLCHENEKGIYGDTPERCVRLMEALPELRSVYDPANFLQCGVDTLTAWDALAPYVHYMHIKDCDPEGNIVPPGEGEGNIAALLSRYAKAGGEIVTLEPHLTEFVGLSDLEEEDDKSAVGGCQFASGREAFDYAIRSIKNIITDLA